MDEIEACFCGLRDLKRDEVAIPPPCGEGIDGRLQIERRCFASAMRAEAVRSIVRKRRPGWGVPQARLPLGRTPTRLTFGQPPSPQGGGIRAAAVARFH